MSDVKMCDNCGNLFSVNEPGWRQFTEQYNGDSGTYGTYNNVHNHGAITKHIGSCCRPVDERIRPQIRPAITKAMTDDNE